MTLRPLLIRFALVLCLLLPGQAIAQETLSTGPIAVEDSRDQDAAIANRLRDILRGLGGYEDVTVVVSDGIVTLRGEVVDPAKVTALESLVPRIEGVVALENRVETTTDVVQRLNPALERMETRIAQTIAYLPLLAVAIVAFGLVVFLGFFIAGRRQPWDRVAPNAFIADIYRQLVRLAFVLGGVVLALDILGATALLSTILGAAGIVGLAIGFAVRDTVENFIASVMLSMRQPFRPNDAVEINGDTGKVIRLTSRATILLSFDGNHIRIPNATVFKSRIVNFTENAERRFLFEIGVASDADLAEARTLIEQTVADLPFVLGTPAPMTWIDRIGDGAIFLTVTGWIDQTETSLVRARGEALRLVKAALEASGVEVPDTTYRVQMIGTDLSSGGPIQPAPAPSPQAQPALVAEDVSATADEDLERLVLDERNDADKPDLLRPEAPHE